MGDAREQARLKQGDVAEQLGVHQVTLSEYENGHAWPPMKLVIGFADMLGLSIDGLVRGQVAKWGMNSAVTVVDKPARGEPHSAEEPDMPSDDLAVILARAFMRVPEQQREAAYDEAYAVLRRRWSQQRHTHERAEGD